VSGRLSGEVVEWLLSPKAQELGLSPAERAVLLVIAERAHETTRVMWRHRTDEISLLDRIRIAAGVSKDGASNLFKKLAKKGLEVRIPVNEDEDGNPIPGKDGRIIFAHHGRSMQFRLPVLPASTSLAGRAFTEPPFIPDETGENPVDNTPGDDGRAFREPGFKGEGRSENRASGSKGVPRNAPNPYKDTPSKEDPSTPVDPSSVSEVEDTGPRDATPPATTSRHMGWDPTYTEASAYLFTLANEGEEFMIIAAAELGQNAPVAHRVIRAAQLANEKGHAA
jgi:hypothetical protein